jgi:hypothetical protein
MEPLEFANPGPQATLQNVISFCSLAQAIHFKKVRDSHPKHLRGKSFDDLCSRVWGMKRARVDHFIRRLDKYGAPAFDLIRFANITDRRFDTLKLGDRISGHQFDCNGHSIEISPENAPALRDAVNSLRVERRTQRLAAQPSQPSPDSPPPSPSPAVESPARGVCSHPKPHLPNLFEIIDGLASRDPEILRIILTPQSGYLGPGLDDPCPLNEETLPRFVDLSYAAHLDVSDCGNVAWFDQIVGAATYPDSLHRLSVILAFRNDEWRILQLQYVKLRQ